MSSEDVVSQAVRLDAAYGGVTLWRNNTGVFTDKTGRPVRYGLANDSAKLNAEFKSSDLIGFTPLVIQPWHVGQTLAVFTAVETKHSDWHLIPSDKRGHAQQRFIDLVRAGGGYAGFVRSVEEFRRLTCITR